MFHVSERHPLSAVASKVRPALAISALLLLLSLLPGVVLGSSGRDVVESLQRTLPSWRVAAEPVWSASGRQHPPGIPTVRTLEGFPASAAKVADLNHFQQLFEAGVQHECALVAVGPVRASERWSGRASFETAWSRSTPDKRIFLSFAKADALAAFEVKRALERDGYICFTYIHGAKNEPWVNSVDVGSYFRQAGVHLVIDSPAARRSAGVNVERSALASLDRGTEPREVPRQRAVTPSESEGSVHSAAEPCCKLCRYLNGVLVGCGPRQCGPQCRNARP